MVRSQEKQLSEQGNILFKAIITHIKKDFSNSKNQKGEQQSISILYWNYIFITNIFSSPTLFSVWNLFVFHFIFIL